MAGDRTTKEGYIYVETEDEFVTWAEGFRVAGIEPLEEMVKDIDPNTVLVAGCTDSRPVKTVVKNLIKAERRVIVDPDLTLIKTSALTHPAAAYENPERKNELMEQLAEDQRKVWAPYEEGFRNQFRLVGQTKSRKTCAI